MSNSKMSFIEEVNPEICQKLAKMSFKQFREFYETPENNNETGEIDDIVVQFKMLKFYCNQQIANNYSMEMNYKYANGKNEGRIFVDGKMGLQRIWKKFRGVLCDGLNIDLDMINAHPTILLYLCKLNKIDCDNLENYVNSRKYCLDSLKESDKLTKEEAKILFICSMNSEEPILCKYEGKKQIKYKNEFYKKFDAEMKNIQCKFTKIYENEFKQIEKKNKDNLNGKLLNSILCKYENQILQKAMARMGSFKIRVPMLDGFMVDIRDVNFPIDMIINTLNKETEEYNIKWSNKNHDVEILDKINNMKFDDNLYDYIGQSEEEIANYILTTLLKNKLFNCDGEKFLYLKPKWIKKDVNKLLFQVLTPHYFYINTFHGPKLINKDTGSLKSLIEMILNLCPNKDDFYKIMHKDTKHRLFYNNGYYDFIQSKFIEYNDDNIPFTTQLINRDYIPNNKLEKEIYEKIFYPIFNIDFDENNEPIKNDKYETMKYTIYQLSRKIGGHIEDKGWLFLLGGRNSGKGIIERLLSYCFEPYVKSFNSGNLISKKSIGELSKELAWMVDFEFSRLIFGSEIDQKLDNKGRNEIKFNGRLIKSIMSGGDELECRTNNKDARKFQIQSTIVLCANDIPTCEPADAMDFCHKIDMPCRFLTDEMYNKLSEGEKKTFVRKTADDSLKNWLSSIDVIQSIEHIIFEAYKEKINMPNCLIHKEDNEEIETAESKLLSLFDFGEEYKHCVIFNNKLQSYLEKHHIAMSMIKCNKILKLNGAELYRNSKQKGLQGLKYIGDDDTEVINM